MPYPNDTRTAPLRRLPDFFPTPPELCRHLVELADVRPRMRVLEPSAGRGDLALALRRARVEPHCLEIQPRLVALLQRQGFAVCRSDFLRLPPVPIYDRIVQNPPFSGGSDALHVCCAYRWLKPGGRLVSVMCRGTLYRRDARAERFRRWLSAVGARVEPLPDGSFARAWRPTKVRTQRVVIDKTRHFRF